MNKVKKIYDLLDDKYAIYGDFNFESNFKYLEGKINKFNGEDILRCGLIGRAPIKTY